MTLDTNWIRTWIAAAETQEVTQFVSSAISASFLVSCDPSVERTPSQTPQRSAAVCTGASHRVVSSSSSFSTEIEAPCISSEVT